MQARLIESRELAPEVRHFVFKAETAPGERFEFIPGQFVSLTRTLGGREITRAYSLASAPDGSRFELCLNRVEEGAFSPSLFEMRPGETVAIRPPLGMFMLRQPPRESLFVATGTGIAPFRSILKAHLTEDSPAFTLLFGVRYESHLFYWEEFEEMSRRFPRFRFWPTVTRPGPEWTRRTGRVQEHLEDAIGERRDLDVYLCGLKAMVDDVRHILKTMGFDRKQIFYEKYD
jgi:CDP-4-dehydro-6-deoxyglucose reductase